MDTYSRVRHVRVLSSLCRRRQGRLCVYPRGISSNSGVRRVFAKDVLTSVGGRALQGT